MYNAELKALFSLLLHEMKSEVGFFADMIYRKSARFIERVPNLKKECQICRKSSQFIERVPNLQKEYQIYKKRTRFIERVPNL